MVRKAQYKRNGSRIVEVRSLKNFSRENFLRGLELKQWGQALNNYFSTIYLLSFVETPRKFIIAELSIYYYSTDEDPSLRIESSAIVNLRGVSTKLNKYIVFTMERYKKLIFQLLVVNLLLISL